MYQASDWRALIQLTLNVDWPTMPNGLHWVEAQIHAESGGDPKAVSPTGAKGLMQLMPGTAADLGVLDVMDPAQNVSGGVRYLRQQWDHLCEIPNVRDRLCWSWASYNAGRGYINVALSLGSRITLDWWKWDIGQHMLMLPECQVQGRHPDYKQTQDYVARILAYHGDTNGAR